MKNDLKKINFPEIDNSIVEVTLADITERVTRKNKIDSSDIPLTISSLDGLVDQRTYFNKTIASKDMSDYYQLHNGEFAYNKSYSSGFPVGSIKRLEKYPKGALSTLYICFKPNERINSDYLKWYFESQKWNKAVFSICTEGVRNHGLLNVSPNDFFQTKHRIHKNLETQRQIAEFFNTIEKKIAVLREDLETAKTLRKELLRKIFSRELRFKDEKKNDFPEWKKKELGEIGYFKSGIGFPKRFQGKKKLEIPFYKVSDMNSLENKVKMTVSNNYVGQKFLETQKREAFEDDGIIFAKIGAALYLDRKRICQPPFFIDNNMMGFFPLKKYNLKYIFYYFQNIKLFKYAQVGALPSLNTRDLAKIHIELCSAEEQEKIMDFFEILERKIEIIEKKKHNWELLKKGLLQQLFPA